MATRFNLGIHKKNDEESSEKFVVRIGAVMNMSMAR